MNAADRFVRFKSTVAVVSVPDIDTDRIIPARFLKGTDKRGLGAHLFADWQGKSDCPKLPMQSKILLAGANFGCGSSREHAAWALVDWGFRAIVAPSFADIFRQNATKNGLLPIALGAQACTRLGRAIRVDPTIELDVDLETTRVTVVSAESVRGVEPGETFSFAVDEFARHCLLNGLDELGYILSFQDQVASHEERNSAA